MKLKGDLEEEKREEIENFKAFYKKLFKKDPPELPESSYLQAYDEIKGEKEQRQSHPHVEAFTIKEEEIFDKFMREVERGKKRAPLLSHFKGLLKGNSTEEENLSFIQIVKESKNFKINEIACIEQILGKKRGAALSLLSERQEKFYNLASDRESSAYTPDDSDSPPIARDARTKKEREGTKEYIEDEDIKGHVETYAKKMMGGFNYDILDDGTFLVNQSSTLQRPTKVKNNFTSEEGRSAGQHLVAMSWQLKKIEDTVRGKEVFQAIRDLVVELDGTSLYNPRDSEKYADKYNGIIQEAKEYLGLTKVAGKENLGEVIISNARAFKFLKEKLIPTVVAIWNQQDTSAFLSNTRIEQSTLLEEARIVQEGLVALDDKSLDKKSQHAIDMYIDHIVDYDVVSSSGSAKGATPHLRTNDIKTLSKVLGRITGEYLDRYNIDQSYYEQVTKDIVKTMLAKKGWLGHLNSKEARSKASELPRIKNQKEGNSDLLVEFFFEEVKKQNPVLYADVLSAKSSFSSLTNSDLKKSPKSTSRNGDTEESEERSPNASETSHDMQVSDERQAVSKHMPSPPMKSKPSGKAPRSRPGSLQSTDTKSNKREIKKSKPSTQAANLSKSQNPRRIIEPKTSPANVRHIGAKVATQPNISAPEEHATSIQRTLMRNSRQSSDVRYSTTSNSASMGVSSKIKGETKTNAFHTY